MGVGRVGPRLVRGMSIEEMGWMVMGFWVLGWALQCDAVMQWVVGGKPINPE